MGGRHRGTRAAEGKTGNYFKGFGARTRMTRMAVAHTDRHSPAVRLSARRHSASPRKRGVVGPNGVSNRRVWQSGIETIYDGLFSSRC